VCILQVFIPIYRGVERHWEFSRCIKLCPSWSFDSSPLIFFLIWYLSYEELISNPFRFQRNNICCNIVVILVLIWRQVTEKVVAETSAELVVVHFSHCPLFTLMKGASDEICFWWPIASDDLASDDVSSGALLQTRFFRRSSSDAFFRRILPDAFKLQMNSFALDLLNQNLYEYIFDHDPVHLNKCLAYPIDNF